MAEQSASTLHSADFAVACASGGVELPQAVKNAFKTQPSAADRATAARKIKVGRWGERGWITLEKYPVGGDRALPPP